MKQFGLLILLISGTLNLFGQENKEKSVPYEEIKLPCFFNSELMIVENQNELDSLANLIRSVPNSNCLDLNPLPEIDFETYLLVGFGAAESGCDLPLIELEFYQKKDSIIVYATVTARGLCDGYGVGKKWCLIQKKNLPKNLHWKEVVSRKFIE